MSTTRVQVCGRLAVLWEGARVEDRLPARQGRLLFAFLVVHRAVPVGRDELAEALGAPDATLRPLLSRLRRVLGADAVTSGDQPRLVLPPDAFVDLDAARDGLHRAEAAVAARDWARGWAPSRIALHTATRGFLAGHDAPWIAEIRRELDEMRLRALECVGDIGLGLGGGELDSAERSGRRLVELAPFRESGHRLLMEALAARGNVAEALLAYERVRTLLRDELGVGPGRELQALHARLLAG
ncbi:MAG TPA: BTAD domain-containing putative transcriptional regulator [Solirubrobacteraceae bacterium]|nr:BTAD domain-containing putative transcriptional regulator [Solirubrobacteraceae bacterium]